MADGGETGAVGGDVQGVPMEYTVKNTFIHVGHKAKDEAAVPAEQQHRALPWQHPKGSLTLSPLGIDPQGMPWESPLGRDWDSGGRTELDEEEEEEQQQQHEEVREPDVWQPPNPCGARDQAQPFRWADQVELADEEDVASAAERSPVAEAESTPKALAALLPGVVPPQMPQWLSQSTPFPEHPPWAQESSRMQHIAELWEKWSSQGGWPLPPPPYVAQPHQLLPQLRAQQLQQLQPPPAQQPQRRRRKQPEPQQQRRQPQQQPQVQPQQRPPPPQAESRLGAPQEFMPLSTFGGGELGGFLFKFTVRRADDVELGLEVEMARGDSVLLVRGVLPNCTIDAWNRQCQASPSTWKAVLPGDKIVQVNKAFGCSGMLEECKQQRLLQFTIVRESNGVTG